LTQCSALMVAVRFSYLYLLCMCYPTPSFSSHASTLVSINQNTIQPQLEDTKSDTIPLEIIALQVFCKTSNNQDYKDYRDHIEQFEFQV